MTLKLRRDADHRMIVATFALLALDYPAEADVCRSLAVMLYGAPGLSAYEAVQAAHAARPATSESSEKAVERGDEPAFRAKG